MSASAIVAYTYQADNICPTCTIDLFIGQGLATPAARDMATEDVLDQVAGAIAIDRADESSYDSDEFPKVVLSCMVEGDEHCGQCSVSLVGGCECVQCVRSQLVAEVLEREALECEDDYRSWGKYDCALADALDCEDWDNDSTGDTDSFAHYRRFDAALAIVETASSGAVSVTTYDTLDELGTDWSEIQRQYEDAIVGTLDGPYLVLSAEDHGLSFRWYQGTSGVHVHDHRGTEVDYFTMGADVPTTDEFVSSVRDHLLCSQ